MGDPIELITVVNGDEPHAGLLSLIHTLRGPLSDRLSHGSQRRRCVTPN